MLSLEPNNGEVKMDNQIDFAIGLMRYGRIYDAIRVLNQAFDDEKNPRTAYYLASCYEQIGDRHKALLWYQQSKFLGNTNVDEILNNLYTNLGLVPVV